MGPAWLGFVAASLCLVLSACGDGLSNAVCGNGILETGEFCDDGNTAGGDGCAADCLFERGPDADLTVPDADPTVPDADPNAPDAPPGQPDGSTIAVVINEFVANDVGADDEEFVEIFGPPSTDLSNLTVISIDGDNTNEGVINGVFAMGTTDANGFFVTPLQADKIQNGTETLLLVDGFTGAVNDDIDAGDDGTIDNQVWTTTIDAVAVLDNGGTTYADTAVIPLDHSPQTGQTLGASRIPDGTDTDLPADWVPADVAAITSGFARVTPGAANAVEP